MSKPSADDQYLQLDTYTCEKLLLLVNDTKMFQVVNIRLLLFLIYINDLFVACPDCLHAVC